MNQYKIEFKEIFTKEIIVKAENESEALDIIEEAYLKTNMLDNFCKDGAIAEIKIIEESEKI